MTSLAEATPSQLAEGMKRRERLARIASRAFLQDELAQRPPVIALPVIAPTPTPLSALRVQWADPDPELINPHITLGKIKLAVSQDFKVSILDMMSQRRERVILIPRQIAIFLARKLTLHSLPMIGRSFGDRDHATVINAVKRAEFLMAADQQLAARVAAIRRTIEGQAA